MTKLSGGEIVRRALEEEGVAFAFGIPGTHNIELYDALAESAHVRPVLVTDEQSASFMADAVWRATGRLACVNVVPGAGLTHALSGIAEAWLDNVAMLVLACGIRRDTGHAFQLHDIDQLQLAAPVTKACFRAESGQELYTTLRHACQLARAGTPGPVLVEVPANLYLFRHDVELHAPVPPPHAPAPTDAVLREAAALLQRARRPLLYVGAGALGAAAHLVELAERLEAPVASTFSGKGVFPESHPLFLWPGFGAAAPAFARTLANECDATLAIGCRFGEVATGSYGMQPPRPLIHVDIDEHAIGRNYPADVAIVADAADAVRELLARLPARSGESRLRARIAEGHRALHDDASAHSAERVSPARLLAALQRVLGAGAIFTADSGNGLFLAVEQLRLDRPRRFLAPVDYSCMGYAVPAAIGAKLAAPDDPVVALAGDGAFLMTGLELITAAAQRAAIIVVVLRDRALAQIAQFQQVALNRTTCSDVGDYDLTTLCTSLSIECHRLERDADIDDVVTRAARTAADGRPVVLDVAIDYSRRTHFTRGVVSTNLHRLPWPDRLRFVARALLRRVTR